jgi:hypothetical protein
MHPHAKEARRTGRDKMRAIGKGGNLDIPVMKSVGENMAGGIRESSASMQHKHKSGASGMKRGGRFGRHRSKNKPDMSALMAAAPPDAAMAEGPPAGAPIPPAGPPMAGPPPMQKHGGRTKKYARGGRHYHDGGEAPSQGGKGYQAGGAADDQEPIPIPPPGEAGTPLPPVGSPFHPDYQEKGARLKRYKTPTASRLPKVEFKRGGRHHSDAAEDKKIVKGMVKGSALKKYARGGGLPMAGHVTKGGAESGEGRLEKTHTGHK